MLRRFVLVLALIASAGAARAQEWQARGAYPADIKPASSVRAASGPADAPARVVLEVQGQTVRLNGRALGAADVPAALAASSARAWPNAIDGHFVFTGPAASTVEINGVRYRLDDGRLVVDTDLADPVDAVVSLSMPASGPTFGARSLILVNEAAPYAAEQEYALEVAALDLATRVRALSPGAEREAALQLLRRHLAELFDFKQAQRARELDALQRELDELRRDHAQRSANRDAIVRKRLGDLLR